jgi:polysaccharide export outer membrane protein
MRTVTSTGALFVILFASLSCSVRPRERDTNMTVIRMRPTSQNSKVVLAQPSSNQPTTEIDAVSVKNDVVITNKVPAVDTISEDAEYRLGYGDVLEVKFFYNSEYNEKVTVRPDGRITLQIIGEISVVGKTPSQVQKLVTEEFGRYLVNPQITVFVREFGGQECYVMGDVEKPGVVEISKGMTLLRAIAAAGGPKRTGKLNSVILVRSPADELAEITRINLKFSSIKKHTELDRPIQAFDVIYVPSTFISDLHLFASQVWDIVLPPIDTWTRYRYWRQWHVNDE